MLKCETQSISNWETGLFLPDVKKLPILKKKMRLQEDEFTNLLAAWRLERTRIDDQKLSFAERKDKEKRRNPSVIIPLYRDRGDTINPVAVPEVMEWLGLFVRKPLGSGIHPICAFMLEDDSMSPMFEHGDILFFDLTKIKLKKNEPYIVCIEDRVYCRLLSRHVRFSYEFKGVGQKAERMTVPAKNISWLYKVIFKQSPPTRITKAKSSGEWAGEKTVKRKT